MYNEKEHTCKCSLYTRCIPVETTKSSNLIGDYYATLKELAAFSTPFLAPLNHLLSPACALQM